MEKPGRLIRLYVDEMEYQLMAILRDHGAVSRIGRKGRTKVFKHGRKGLWVPTLTELFPKIQADASS